MRSRRWALGLALAAGLLACRGRADRSPAEPGGSTPAGVLLLGVRAEPVSWNPLVAADRVSHVIGELVHAGLFRVDGQTQEVLPGLAEDWELLDGGRELLVRLRSDGRFSDGAPVVAEDVVFTFRALYDATVASPLADTLRFGAGGPRVEAVDTRTVRFRLPRPTAALTRRLARIPVLPRRRLEPALREGAFGAAYGLGAAPADVVGAGAFRLARYLPGQRIVLERNPHYWGRDECGGRLPFLDGVVVEILPGPDAGRLRLARGELDVLDAVTAEDFVALRRAEGVRLADLGPGLAAELLWFNLRPDRPGPKAGWFRDSRFRRAVAAAIDREAIARAVYYGLASPATGALTSAGHGRWRNETLPPLAYEPNRARRLLREAGFSWDGRGRLRGPEDELVSFRLLLPAGQPERLKMAALVERDLAALGMEVHVLPLETGALVHRLTRSGEYDACLYGVRWTDSDPSSMAPLWKSGSPLHLWSPSQPRPATPWEARIDTLLDETLTSLDPVRRKELFDELQAVAAMELPVIGLVNPHELVATSSRLGPLRLGLATSPVLWDVDRIRAGVESEGVCPQDGT